MVPLFEPHNFWDSQPVPKVQDEFVLPDSEFNKPIIEQNVEDISTEPLTLPPEYFWESLDLNDDSVAQEMYDLLVRNYVADEDEMFRFNYAIPFIRWACVIPNGEPDWLLGVRGGKNRRLYGCITGIPVTLKINGVQVQAAEINFLCVHNQLRARRLAPILIKEVTRRINLKGIF